MSISAPALRPFRLPSRPPAVAAPLLLHPPSSVVCPALPLLRKPSRRFSFAVGAGAFHASIPTVGDRGPEGWDPSQLESLQDDQLTSVLQDVVALLEDMEMDEASEVVAVEIEAQGVINKRVDEMEGGFMMALDYMIQMAEKTIEARPTIPDRKLLARLVLIREEARNMMGGGLLDERNDLGLSTLPEAEAS